jgi:hypothetical protein
VSSTFNTMLFLEPDKLGDSKASPSLNRINGNS